MTTAGEEEIEDPVLYIHAIALVDGASEVEYPLNAKSWWNIGQLLPSSALAIPIPMDMVKVKARMSTGYIIFFICLYLTSFLLIVSI